MRFLSLFSGIEAASVAWTPLGWEAVGLAEVDPYASAVLRTRYPSVPNYGDVTKIDVGERDTHAIVTEEGVRRLTPTDAERIMGFPDGWTNALILRGNKAYQAPDSKRMKALGNSMAVPVMRWIGLRLQRAHRWERTQA